jgi:serine/threonine protein kinase
LELCGYSLEDLLKSPGHLPHPEVRINSIQILGGIKHIHKHRLIHGDIKPANILVGRDGNLKISDFGFAVDLQASRDQVLIRGTLRYMAPELLRPEGKYGQSINMWSFGVLL